MEFEDDPDIDNEDYLLRRLIALPVPGVKQIVWDDNRDCWMPSSAAFDDPEMSVTIEKDLFAQHLTHQDAERISPIHMVPHRSAVIQLSRH